MRSLEYSKNVTDIMQEIHPNDCIILSHADHDGFSSSVLLNSYFMKKYGNRAKIMYPTKSLHYFELLYAINHSTPKYLIIVDSPLQRYTNQLMTISKKTIIINFDHHDILKIKNQNFIDCNPHLRNLEFLNSSALVWELLMAIDREFFKKRCWVAGIGAAQDYCLEDSIELFDLIKKMGLIDRFDLESLVKSKLMSLAKLIRASISLAGPEYTYDSFLDACMTNDADKLLHKDSKLSSALDNYRKELSRIESFVKDKYIIHSRNGLKIKFCNLAFSSINYVSDICELEKEPAIYIAYKDGKVSLRALFVQFDVRPLAKHLGGGGPNSRAAGANTSLSYNEMIQRVLGYLEQQTLF
jgi:nanoRNase/pAp phosphatase (c-di-AMP/oligoRNAs hydrolase)